VTLTGTVRFPHEIETLRWMIGGVPGVVEIHNEVTAEQSEPRAEPPAAFPGGYTRLV